MCTSCGKTKMVSMLSEEPAGSHAGRNISPVGIAGLSVMAAVYLGTNNGKLALTVGVVHYAAHRLAEAARQSPQVESALPWLVDSPY